MSDHLYPDRAPSQPKLEARIAELEARVAELEAKLAESEARYHDLVMRVLQLHTIEAKWLPGGEKR